MVWLGRTVLRCARNTPPVYDANVELMLVPGMRLSTGEPNHDYRLRLNRANLLHKQHGSKILLMGGITAGESLSETVAGKQFLENKGVSPSSLHMEDGSRNTLENLRNTREQLRNLNIERYALISNRYHLARCQALANGLGMYPVLCAAEENFKAPPSTWPRLILETYYLHWYHTGKLWSRVTGNSHSLDRIS